MIINGATSLDEVEEVVIIILPSLLHEGVDRKADPLKRVTNACPNPQIKKCTFLALFWSICLDYSFFGPILVDRVDCAVIFEKF